MVDGLILRINTKHLFFNEGHLMRTEDIHERLCIALIEGEVMFPAHFIFFIF